VGSWAASAFGSLQNNLDGGGLEVSNKWEASTGQTTWMTQRTASVTLLVEQNKIYDVH
jgi:hypothetical protein